MNFSGINRKSILGTLLRLPLKIIPEDTVLPILQGPMRGNKWVVGSFNHGCWLGSYEFEKQEAFIDAVEFGYSIYDIGAHVGFYTLLSSILTGQEGCVYAFEPLPRNFDYLSKHKELNELENTLIYQLAVGDSYQEVNFKSDASSAMGRVDITGELKIQQITMDEFVSKNNLRPPHIIKVDVEGAEYAVLKGAENLITEYHPIIFLATHGSVVKQQCIDLLRHKGYEIEPLGNASYDESDEFIAK